MGLKRFWRHEPGQGVAVEHERHAARDHEVGVVRQHEVQVRLVVLPLLPSRASTWPVVTRSPTRTLALPVCRCAYTAQISGRIWRTTWLPA